MRLDINSPYVDDTQKWIEQMVIGLNLCPFAKRVFQTGRLRYVVSKTSDLSELLMVLAKELQSLKQAPMESVETTLLVHPFVLNDFREFNDFLGVAEELLENLGLRGEIQIASFHPKYQFAGTSEDSVENYTNRSPYPTLHLLREASISDLMLSENELAAIPARNVEHLKSLGLEAVKARLES